MRQGDSLHIQLSEAQGSPLTIANVYVVIQLFTRGNYRYGFMAGHTDAAGRIVVTYDSLEEQRRENSAMFIMDYNTQLEDCDPVAKLVVYSEQDLRAKRSKALKTFGNEPSWATPWPSNALVEVTPLTIQLMAPTVRVNLPARRLS
jgi:hypothetical protein